MSFYWCIDCSVVVSLANNDDTVDIQPGSQGNSQALSYGSGVSLPVYCSQCCDLACSKGPS